MLSVAVLVGGMSGLRAADGESMAERAGDRQRVLAVVREESLDTLENRVLRAYCELAWHVAREYRERYAHLQKSRRVTQVEAFGRQCRRLAHELAARGVRRGLVQQLQALQYTYAICLL